MSHIGGKLKTLAFALMVLGICLGAVHIVFGTVCLVSDNIRDSVVSTLVPISEDQLDDYAKLSKKLSDTADQVSTMADQNYIPEDQATKYHETADEIKKEVSTAEDYVTGVSNTVAGVKSALGIVIEFGSFILGIIWIIGSLVLGMRRYAEAQAIDDFHALRTGLVGRESDDREDDEPSYRPRIDAVVYKGAGNKKQAQPQAQVQAQQYEQQYDQQYDYGQQQYQQPQQQYQQPQRQQMRQPRRVNNQNSNY